MIEQEEESPTRQSRTGGWGWPLLDATLAFVLLATATTGLTLPLHHVPDGVVSKMTRARYHPLTNYLKYAIMAGGTLVVFAVAAQRGTGLVLSLATGLARALARVTSGRRWTTLGALAIMAFAILLVNRTAVDPASPLTDTYHEGERLAFVPAVRASGSPLAHVFLIHGFGADVLPSVLAGYLATEGHQIALTRVMVAILQALGHLGALLAVVLAARLERPAMPWRPPVVGGLASLVVVALVFRIDVRDTAYLLQLPLIMLFLTAARTARGGITVMAAAAVGLSLPLAFLYVYDRAIYMLILTLIMTLPLLSLGWRVSVRWLAGVSVGVVLGVAIVVGTAGVAGAGAIVEQVRYWARYSAYINARPLFAWPSCCTVPAIRDLVLLGMATVGQCLTVAFLWSERERRGGLRAAIRTHLPLTVLFVASVVFMRIATERSDTPHFYFATVPSMLLLAVLVGTTLAARLEDIEPLHLAPQSPPATVLILVLVFVFGLLAARAAVLNPVSLARPLNPGSALSALRTWVRHASVPDHDILLPDDREAMIAVREEIAQSHCFFTLTSEGTWYYLFQRPSCSRFHQLWYARTGTAQDEVIAALATNRPALLLFSNNRDMKAIEGTSVFNTNAAVARYVMTAYRPYRLIAGHHWFWRRVEEPYRFVDDPAGRLDVTVSEADARRDLIVTGTLIVAPSVLQTATVFVTLGPRGLPIWAGHTVQAAAGGFRFWAEIPTGALPRGASVLHFWLMTDPAGPLRSLGSATVSVA
jgi:hypothetical protein